MSMAQALNDAMDSSIVLVRNTLEYEDECVSSEDEAEDLAQRVVRR